MRPGARCSSGILGAFPAILALLMGLLGAVPAHAQGRLDLVTGLPACEVMAAALRNSGMEERMIPVMVAISMAESGCRRDATYQTERERSVGPLQINLMAHRGVKESCARQYHCSARVALRLMARQGLHAWSAYGNGRYRAYLKPARAAAGRAQTRASYSSLVAKLVNRSK